MSKKKLLLPAFLIVFLVCLSSGVMAQPQHRQIKWNDPVVKTLKSSSGDKVLSFEGGVYLTNELPQYVERFPVANASSKVSVQLTGAQYEPLKEASLITNDNQLNSDIKIKTEIVVEKKKAYAQVSFIPVRKNGSSYEKLTSFNLNVAITAGAALRTAARYFAPSSVLASGSWYKIGVTNDGVYKLTYAQLEALGMNVSNLSSANLRLYGNGGGMLPFLNSAPRYDDLQENAIQVVDGNDGVFNSGDYILFYGQSQTRWSYNAAEKRYHHQVNFYSDTTYYFITADLGAGKRIQAQPSTSTPATVSVNTFDDYAYHEVNSVSWLKSGREWYGEQFDELNNSNTFQFTFPNHVDSIYIKSDVWARSVSYATSFDLSVNGNNLMRQWMQGAPNCFFCTYAMPCSTATSTVFLDNSDVLNVRLKFNPNASNPQGQGWLNYLEINARRMLTMPANVAQMTFRNAATTGVGQVAEYTLGGTTATTQVWDITDPLNVSLISPNNNTGSALSFRVAADSLREFISFHGTEYGTPALFGRIENQNLHGLSQAEMVIVVHPNFMNAAQRLAKLHRDNDNMTVHVVTPQQIYNEFSGGSQDVTAIRDFMKMFYDRSTGAADAPNSLLLFGRGSVDPKHRIPNNTNYVICYESANSNEPTQSYMSDDFFAFLDENEGNWEDGSSNLMDIAVGRLPAKTAAEADALVDKIVHYTSTGTFTAGTGCTAGTSSSHGDWRNIIAFVSDDEDSNIHLQQSDFFANYVATNYPKYNIDKIYIDSYKQQATPGGARYPDARDAIVSRVQRGALLLDYIGHGGPVGWAEERILENDDINGWTNYDRLSAWITATCDFSVADDPTITSAGELVLLNTRGGGISLFTTTRLAYSQANFDLGKKFFTHIFNPVGDRMPRMGEICMLTKNQYPSISTRNFILLGDPALTLAYPKVGVTTTAIDADTVTGTSIPDTMKALQKVTVRGFVDDGNGNKLTGFNGVIYPTVFDKAVSYRTLANDAASYVTNFKLQKSILYKGAASVTNGDFSFTFVVPKDISYQYGFGRLSYYASDNTTDASGYFENFIIGGANANAVADNVGPMVKLYMNDTTFVYGGLTDQNPSIYARIIDSSGVSTVGNGIGHDITAQLDDDNGKMYVLNDYYQADLNSYQSGKVIYGLKDLAVGTHNIKFKVWDVYNNSSEARLEFVVGDDAKLMLTHVLNYPNPFTTNTKFFFEHNKPCMPLVVQVQIYTVSGKLVKTIREDIQCDGFRSDKLVWDGLDDYGDKIGRGVYVYRLKVHAPDGTEADKFEKLVVLR